MLNKYISAIWADMVARMSGLASLVFTFLGVYSRWFEGVNGGQYAKEFFYVVAILCFLFANYRIWADEHRKVISTLPDFSLAIEQMRWELTKDNNTALVFAVFMLNKGAPSVARGWDAYYIVGVARERMALFYISGEWILSGDHQTVTIKPEDQIVAKTMERRVETGEAKTGRIFFSLLGDRQNQLKSLQFSVEISFMDFTGKRIVGKFIPDPSPVIGVALYPSEKGTILPKPEAPLLSDGKKAN